MRQVITEDTYQSDTIWIEPEFVELVAEGRGRRDWSKLAAVAIALAHLGFASAAFYLAKVPAAIILYLGLFGSSEKLGSVFSLLMYPVLWFVITIHPFGPIRFPPSVWWLCTLAGSVFYGLLTAAIVSGVRYVHHARSNT